MGGVYGGKDLRKRYFLILQWKRVGVMEMTVVMMGQMSLDNSDSKTC